MTAVPLPDAEGGCRTWLRSLPSVSALVGARVFFAAPDNAEDDDYPMVTVSRVGGTLDTGEAPLDVALLQLTCIGPRRDKASATALANAVRGEVAGLRDPVPWGPTDVCLGASEESTIFTVDPSDGRPRYSVTVAAVVRAAAS